MTTREFRHRVEYAIVLIVRGVVAILPDPMKTIPRTRSGPWG